jgi:hypothetical protein
MRRDGWAMKSVERTIDCGGSLPEGRKDCENLDQKVGHLAQTALNNGLVSQRLCQLMYKVPAAWLPETCEGI